MSERRTALHLAAASGAAAAVEFLLRSRADAARGTKTKATALHLAASENHLAVAKLLLEPDPVCELSAADLWRCTALHRAAERGAHEVAMYLLQRRADPSKADREGNSPLHWAAISGCSLLIEELLQRKVATDFANNEGFSPLDLCVRHQHRAAGDVLVAAGAKLVKDIRKSPPTMISAAASGLPFLCSYLLRMPERDVKKSLGEVDDQGRSPLLLAAASGDAEVFERLLSCPLCRPECLAKCGRAPLHEAAREGKVQVLQLLQERSVELDARDASGNTALAHAAMAGRTEAMRWLIEHGLRPETCNDAQRSGLHLAAESGAAEACDLLLEMAEDAAALLNCQDWEGATAAHMAVRGGHAEVCRRLAEQRADLQEPTVRFHVHALEG
ncbi:unnamed protein product [Effrenium voratum]|nr:unnamed protein product [Effrenium voratum]